MGVVPQEMAFYEELSAKENLYFWGKLQGLGKKTLEERIQYYLKKTGLLGRENDAFHKLIFFGYDFKSVFLNIFVLFVYTLIFLIIAVKFFKLRKT